MALMLYKKLRISEGMLLLTRNAPANFVTQLGELPTGVKVLPTIDGYNQIHWFVTDRQQMEKEVDAVLALLKPDIVCWIYYPKGSSKIQTDLTRDKGWDALLKYQQLQWLSLISFDDTWSAFGMRLQNQPSEKKPTEANERVIFEYADAATKTVRLPEDLKKALEKNPKASDVFEALSFTSKKEYVEWIVTAKRDETRNERVTGTIERLAKGWKNPRNI